MRFPAYAYPWHMAITLTIDQKDLQRATAWSKAVAKQLPFATTQALTTTAFSARDALKGASKTVFDKPTTFIQNAWRVQKATKATLTAIVYPEDRRRPYLKANILGGARGTKPFEAKLLGAATGPLAGNTRLIPGVVRRNAQGNVSLATLKKIGNNIATTGKNSVFIGTPSGGNRPAGVYQRTPKGTLLPLFIAVRKASYQRRFKIDDIGSKIVQRRFNQYLMTSLEKALATAR
jgi:hypothetical protein